MSLGGNGFAEFGRDEACLHTSEASPLVEVNPMLAAAMARFEMHTGHIVVSFSGPAEWRAGR